MTKISIIIPTIHQKDENGYEYINLIEQKLLTIEIDRYFEDYEIIIIENKLTNEAWCEGVEQSTGDILLILNDDIIINESVFAYLSNLKEGQVYCPNYSRKEDFKTIYNNNGNNIVGFCFGLYKKDWKPIPEELGLWYGDNFIYEYMNHNILWGGYIHHWESKSLGSPEQKEKCDKIIQNDIIEWNGNISKQFLINNNK